MRRKMIFGKKAMGNSFIQRPPASLFGNDEAEKEEEEEENEDEDEEHDEEEEEDEGRKGWSD